MQDMGTRWCWIWQPALHVHESVSCAGERDPAPVRNRVSQTLFPILSATPYLEYHNKQSFIISSSVFLLHCGTLISLVLNSSVFRLGLSKLTRDFSIHPSRDWIFKTGQNKTKQQQTIWNYWHCLSLRLKILAPGNKPHGPQKTTERYMVPLLESWCSLPPWNLKGGPSCLPRSDAGPRPA